MGKLGREEAAELLGVSVRTLTNLASAGKISVAYAPGKTRAVALFDRDELERLKAERGQTTYRPAIGKNGEGDLPDASQLQLARRDGGIGKNEAMALPDVSRFVAAVEAFAKGLEEQAASRPVSELAHQLMLSRPEAARLAGVSEHQVKLAIASKRLKAQIVGRAWKVKRADLEAWVKKL